MNKELDINKVQEYINKLELEKNRLNSELQNIEVQIKVIDQNLENINENLIQEFGTADEEKLKEIYIEKQKELQEWINEVNTILN